MSQVIERGSIYFLYRPRKAESRPAGREDIQRAYLILSPDTDNKHRLIIIGHKKLPEIVPGESTPEERVWGFVDAVSREPDDLLRKLEVPADEQPDAEGRMPRPAGEGRYALVRHEDHTHLAYALELPDRPGPVQTQLDIREEASYIISVKNPERPSPIGLSETARYPKKLQALFHGRKFIPVAQPDLLDYDNAELLLIGASTDVEQELGIRLDSEQETAADAEIFRQLRLDREQLPVDPLLEGEWR